MKPLELLILGGTGFLGRHLVESAHARGHRVTLFNRGRTRRTQAPVGGVEQLRGDRGGHLVELAGRTWDAVVDTCGYVPSQVQASSRRLASSVDQHVFISTLSVYSASTARGPVDESAPLQSLDLATLPALEAIQPSGEVIAEAYGESYGGLKALCEREVTAAVGQRALIVRPGLIVGPHDPTDRFTYWPARVARGGQVLAPGSPKARCQFIDARDLAGWIVDAAERKIRGTFNVTGPASELTMGRLLETCCEVIRAGTDRQTAPEPVLRWVPDDVLLAAGVAPWTGLPLWIPSALEQIARPLWQAAFVKALDAGLRHRPLFDTIRDTLEWDCRRGDPAGSRRAGLTAQRERELLAVWDARAGEPPA